MGFPPQGYPTPPRYKMLRDLFPREYGTYGSSPQSLQPPAGKRWVVFGAYASPDTGATTLRLRARIGGDWHYIRDDVSSTVANAIYPAERLPTYISQVPPSTDYVRAEVGAGNVLLIVCVLEYEEGEEYS